MTAPGWYHADGDPAGTARYWDGRTWVGEPTTDASHNNTVFYAATEPSTVLGHATAQEQATGAIAYTTTSREPDPVAAVPPVQEPQAAIPESAQLIAIGLSALKSLGLLLLLVNTMAALLLGTIALQLSYNEDVETVLEWTVGISLATIAIGAALLAAQAAGAAQNRPVVLLVAALCMSVIDGVLTLGAWTNEHSTDQFFYTGLLTLQVWVAVGAIIALVRGTS